MVGRGPVAEARRRVGPAAARRRAGGCGGDVDAARHPGVARRGRAPVHVVVGRAAALVRAGRRVRAAARARGANAHGALAVERRVGARRRRAGGHVRDVDGPAALREVELRHGGARAERVRGRGARGQLVAARHGGGRGQRQGRADRTSGTRRHAGGAPGLASDAGEERCGRGRCRGSS